MFAFLLATAVVIIRLRDLFAAAMLTGIYSLLSAGLFMVMDAADVAFTEAAVGAGISTVLFIASLALTRRHERADRPAFKPVPLLLVLLTGAAMVYGTFDMPRYGDPEAPVHQHRMARHFLERSPEETGIPNVVTSVLASYRGYDTFGEATVIFAAGVGVLLLLGAARPRTWAEDAARDVDRGADTLTGLRRHYVLRVALKPFIPLIMLFALYVQFHGEYGAGGGFQAGVIFAAAIVLYALIFGLADAHRVFPRRRLEIFMAGGVLLYGLVGVATMLLGGNFLDYDVLAHDHVHGQHRGILLIELGVGVAVAAVMSGLFFLYALRGHHHDPRA